MTDIFREVEEDLRRDRALQLWRRYGKFLIAAVVLVIVGTAVGVGWREYQQRQQLHYSAQFAAAMDLVRGERLAEATSALAALGREAGPGYATLARFKEATLKTQAGDAAGAVAVYESLAGDRSIDPLYAGLARLYAVLHRIDEGDPDALASELQPLLAPDNPWRYSARELSALLALRKGDAEAARNDLATLTDDPGAPPGIRSRAAEMLRALES